MVSATLISIESWYNEQTSDQTRLILLSKLAMIEFCGWLEEWMDSVIRDIDGRSIQDKEWVEKKLIASTYGFHYDKHFRPMLCALLGEYGVRDIEAKFEVSHPGDLEHMKSTLGMLWTARCKLAHADLSAHQAAQLTVNAPSWTKSQFGRMSRILENFRICLLANI